MLDHLFRTSALAIVVGGLATTGAAEMKYENDTGGHVRLYGQFNPAYLSFDDGLSNTSSVVDNQNSNSRVGLWVVQPYGDMTFSFNFETSLGLKKSSLLSQNFTPDDINWERREIRKVDFKLETASAGTFYLGQGSVSSDGASHSDLSGTTLVVYNSIGDSTGSFFLQPVSGGTARPVIQAFPNYDGGRRLRVRYDSPEILPGLKLSASYGEEVLISAVDLTTSNAALLYSRKVGAFQMKGALAHSVIDLGLGAKRHDTIGSFSALHESGFNVSVSAGDRREDGDYVYGKLGYLTDDWFNVGQTALAIDYYDGSDQTVAGSESASVGVAVVQSFDDLNLEAYLGYRTYSLSEPGVTYHDASSVMFGARWKF